MISHVQPQQTDLYENYFWYKIQESTPRMGERNIDETSEH